MPQPRKALTPEEKQAAFVFGVKAEVGGALFAVGWEQLEIRECGREAWLAKLKVRSSRGCGTDLG